MTQNASYLTSDGVPETESAKPSWPSLPQGDWAANSTWMFIVGMMGRQITLTGLVTANKQKNNHCT